MSAGVPSQALENLRAEVALLRLAIEGMASKQTAAPDYTPTLGRIMKLVAELGEKIEKFEDAPALMLTPSQIADQLQVYIDRARAGAQQEVGPTLHALNQASQAMTRAAGVVRTRDLQRQWLIGAAGAGAVGALLFWAATFGPFLRMLPAGWQAPERMAAAILGQDRWAAGGRLMAGADAEAWARVHEAERLLAQNPKALEACRKRAARTGRAVSCEVRIGG